MLLEIFFSPDPKHEIVPIYNLLIAEEGHTRILKPTLFTEDFIKFSRNSYLVKLTSRPGIQPTG